MEATERVRDQTRKQVWDFLLESDFGERYYQEVCARVFRFERGLQAVQFLLSSGALVSLLAAGINPIWPKITAFAAATISAILLAQKLSRSSSTATQLQEGWADLHREAELLWARLDKMTEEEALAIWEKLCREEKVLDARATQAFPASRYKALAKECWAAMLRDRKLQTSS